MNEDDLFLIERAARHLSAALESFEGIPPLRMSRDVLAQFKRMTLAEHYLRVIRDQEMKRLGTTKEEVEAWSTP